MGVFKQVLKLRTTTYSARHLLEIVIPSLVHTGSYSFVHLQSITIVQETEHIIELHYQISLLSAPAPL